LYEFEIDLLEFKRENEIGPSKYTIFFSTNGARPIVDEIANNILDGDMYWICDNAEVLKIVTIDNLLKVFIYTYNSYNIYV